jgi:hypothetical protein
VRPESSTDARSTSAMRSRTSLVCSSSVRGRSGGISPSSTANQTAGANQSSEPGPAISRNHCERSLTTRIRVAPRRRSSNELPNLASSTSSPRIANPSCRRSSTSTENGPASVMLTAITPNPEEVETFRPAPPCSASTACTAALARRRNPPWQRWPESPVEHCSHERSLGPGTSDLRPTADLASSNPTPLS